MASSTTALNKDVGELLNLLLSTAEGAEALLGELTGTLILVVLQQLHATLLVGSEAGDLTDEVADELDALVQALEKIWISIIQSKRGSSRHNLNSYDDIFNLKRGIVFP